MQRSYSERQELVINLQRTHAERRFKIKQPAKHKIHVGWGFCISSITFSSSAVTYYASQPTYRKLHWTGLPLLQGFDKKLCSAHCEIPFFSGNY